MASTSKLTSEKMFIQIGNEKFELTGADKEAFIADIQEIDARISLREAEYKAKQDARDSAIKKLGEIAGLTKEELDAIL
jgi:hypothetical protein